MTVRRHPSLAALAALGIVTAAVAVPGAAMADDADGPTYLAPVHDAPAGDDTTLVNETTGRWFVELASPPSAQGTAKARIAREQAAFRQAARAAGVEYTETRSFDTLFNGFSIEMGSAQLGKLRATRGVEAIYPMVSFSVPEPQTASGPDMATALGMTGADVAQSELGLTGAGVKVAVMDTGIDYQHPDLGGPGAFPTDRVAYGHDFVGDAYDASSTDAAKRVPRPDPDPMDCQGHGTHVAGIVGADGEVRGVAPDVTFGAYRVFGCDGSTDADIMIAAMEMALADGMDVLNMSIGSAFTWPTYPTATASNALVDAGMVVVASIGNSGASGVYSTGAPGTGEKVIGVGSVDNTHSRAKAVVANPSGAKVAYTELGDVAPPPTSGETDELVYVGRGCPSLGDTLAADPAGRTALLVRGDCAFEEKYATAAAAGATAVVIANNTPGMFSGGGVVDRGIPGIGISQADGTALREQIAAGASVTLTWTDEEILVASPTAGRKSSFSSYGLAPDLTLKPDLAAPGGNIYSTYPLAKGGHATLSGTSMAAPHVAGAVALLLEARPDLAAPAVRDLLQNTADPVMYNASYVETVHGQGAGLVDVPAAHAATAGVTPAKLSLGESETGPVTTTLTVTNDGDAEVTYDLSSVEALSTGGSTFAPGLYLAAADVAFSADTLTVPAGGSAQVDVTVTAPGAPQSLQLVYGGYVVLTGDDGSELSVPFAGFDGDYQGIRAITPIGTGENQVDLPWLTRLTECAGFIGLDCVDPAGSYEKADGESFSLRWVDGLPDYPYVVAHLAHQVEDFELYVVDAATGRTSPTFAMAADLGALARNGSAGAFHAFVWDGTVTRANGSGKQVTRPAGDGDYRLEIRALKANGDRSNPDHWETWTSPVFTIDRD
ncbi:S8 family serine peptidase [Isoptericola variabilis]|uniref:Lactocepin n=1 Tax=Isoptericola variabilis (strain 225) TaxID=743718 RepID=F6FRH8_ISOV2|nr:S8 family serine peptidase [Isoptericola variabilis]AEG45036.1 Lactocepin [Isoptericola variabilis 225]TWH26163.1 Subtilisin-like serine proteases [Isoptericola variabilis J7]